MTRIEELEEGIMALSRPELTALRDWFQNYLGDQWDRQIEEDAAAGRLDSLAEEALSEHRAGKTEAL